MFVKVDSDKCDGCGKCESACPCGAITIEDNKAVINDNCCGCMTCIDACEQKNALMPN